jgi:hypothetical protein
VSARASATTSATRLGLALALVLAGCRDAGREEARAIARAYEDFENAGAPDRPAALKALQSARCSEASLCADRDACATYAASIVKTKQLTDKARELGPEDAGGNGAATESELAIIVAGAQDALDEAEKQAPRCHEALTRLHQRAR